jgi:GntR family transcriptional regulator
MRVAIVAESARHSLKARLRELISSIGVGNSLPSERDLSARWGVARMTIRRSVDTLVAEGLVERRHGSGTYVTPQPFARLQWLGSFSKDMRNRGLEPSARLLAYRVAPADSTMASQLNITAGDPVVRFTRLRLGSGEPMAVETVWIAQTLVPGIKGDDLDGSLYELLASRYLLILGSASVSIEAVVPNNRVCELLTIADKQACLRIRMVDFDSRGKVIMIANGYYRGEKYQITAEISRGSFATEHTINI